MGKRSLTMAVRAGGLVCDPANCVWFDMLNGLAAVPARG
ncbi:hypothetical protein BH10PSE12_BH10PSE12_31800 [soil metagenome]